MGFLALVFLLEMCYTGEVKEMQIMSGKICCSQNELHKFIMPRIKLRGYFNSSNFVYQVIF